MTDLSLADPRPPGQAAAPRRRAGIYFTGSLTIPTAAGPVDLGILARALLQGLQARVLGGGVYRVTSSNRFEAGPYEVCLTADPATCSCPAGQHGSPCKHVHLSRLLHATLEESA